MQSNLKRHAIASAVAAAALAIAVPPASAQDPSGAAAKEQTPPRHQGQGVLSTGVSTNALGGLNAPNARLAGLIDAGGAPIRTKGIQSITRISVGTYCIRPTDAANINVATAGVMLTPEYFYSQLNEIKVQWAAGGSKCPAGQFAVYTLADPNRDGVYTFSNAVGFTIFVP